METGRFPESSDRHQELGRSQRGDNAVEWGYGRTLPLQGVLGDAVNGVFVITLLLSVNIAPDGFSIEQIKAVEASIAVC